MRFMFELSNTAISRVEWILFHAYGRVIRMFINPHKTSISFSSSIVVHARSWYVLSSNDTTYVCYYEVALAIL